MYCRTMVAIFLTPVFQMFDVASDYAVIADMIHNKKPEFAVAFFLCILAYHVLSTIWIWHYYHDINKVIRQIFDLEILFECYRCRHMSRVSYLMSQLKKLQSIIES